MTPVDVCDVIAVPSHPCLHRDAWQLLMVEFRTLVTPCPFVVEVRNGSSDGTLLWTSPCGAAAASGTASPAFLAAALHIVAPQAADAPGFVMAAEVRAVPLGYNADRLQSLRVGECGAASQTETSASTPASLGGMISGSSRALFGTTPHALVLPANFGSGYMVTASSADVDSDGDEVSAASANVKLLFEEHRSLVQSVFGAL